ncbi:hypothetical protein GN958_ATG15940 [Phytophthora infestans]|uniref:M96 mating-specific protein family n=1 Tax=Phytophthora infestans TaxID=4787 RepID=A0A8S9U737_PHYIN|nr:hypothetical protein GN958_ATG15940 [Phytophthora infestans]
MLLSSAEQRVLDSFLLEMDVSDFAPDTLKSMKRVEPKRKANTASRSSTKKLKLSWERRREELQTLRAEVKALHEYKVNLELQAIGNLQQEAETRNRWKNAADMEKQWCQQAQDTNTQLKSKLQRCMQTCDSLKTMINASLTKVSINSTLQDLKIERIDTAGPMLFNLLEQRLNKRVHDLRDVYVATPNASTDFDLVQVHRGGGAQGASALEFKRTRLLPFTATVTANTVGDVMKLGVVSDERCAHAYMRSERHKGV